jgi:hypothetical protein
MTTARQKIAVITSFRKSNKKSLDVWAGDYRSSRKKKHPISPLKFVTQGVLKVPVDVTVKKCKVIVPVCLHGYVYSDIFQVIQEAKQLLRFKRSDSERTEPEREIYISQCRLPF